VRREKKKNRGSSKEITNLSPASRERKQVVRAEKMRGTKREEQ